MAEQQNVTQQEAEVHSKQMFTNANPQQYKQYVDDQMYIQNLAQQYLNRIEARMGLTQEQKDRDKAKFVTFCRGIIAEVEQQPPDANGNRPMVTRNGQYTYKQVFDLGFETLFPEPEEDKDEPVAPKEPPAPKQAAPKVAPETRRIPGDIQPVPDGEEDEGYTELFGKDKQGMENWMKIRKQHYEDTKTLKNARSSEEWMTKQLEELRKKGH